MDGTIARRPALSQFHEPVRTIKRTLIKHSSHFTTAKNITLSITSHTNVL